MIKHIIEEKIDVLSRCGEKVNKSFDKETIHSFRIKVKSIRAFLRLIRSNQSIDGLKLSRKFKRLYHIAGGIREAQLELHEITTQQYPLYAYTEKLELEIKTEKSEWVKYYSKKIFQKLYERLDSASYNKIMSRHIEDFFKTRMALIVGFQTIKQPTITQLHNIRKRAKDILYISNILKEYWPAGNKLLRTVPIKKLDKLSDIIGEYHDKKIMLVHMHASLPEGMPTTEKDIIKNIYTTDTAKLRKEKAKVIASVHEFIMSETGKVTNFSKKNKPL